MLDHIGLAIRLKKKLIDVSDLLELYRTGRKKSCCDLVFATCLAEKEKDLLCNSRSSNYSFYMHIKWVLFFFLRFPKLRAGVKSFETVSNFIPLVG